MNEKEKNHMIEHAETESTQVEDIEHTTKEMSEHPLTALFRYLYEIIKTVIIVLVFALAIRTFAIQPFIVDGRSMEPTFHDHEYLMVEKINFAFHAPNRGDIIVFRYPLNPSLNYVKRIIGLPGDRVVVSQGKIIIYNNEHTQGLELKEPYLASETLTRVQGDTRERTWIVEPDTFFVMGDNRDHSDDSRIWGTVPKKNIVGKVWVTIYPFENFGLVQHSNYE